MAQLNLGSIKFNWRNAYNASTAYSVDDVVSYLGSSYICIAASTGNVPTNTTYWSQMSSKGTDADLLSITSTAQVTFIITTDLQSQDLQLEHQVSI